MVVLAIVSLFAKPDRDGQRRWATRRRNSGGVPSISGHAEVTQAVGQWIAEHSPRLRRRDWPVGAFRYPNDHGVRW
jgi:hypothetical protein